jgi:hypothetical protein
MCIYIYRLAEAALISPIVNYWWQGLPTNLLREAYKRELAQDQWAIRVAHYMPWLTYWWNTQKWFPASSAVAGNINSLSPQDLQIMSKVVGTKISKVRTVVHIYIHIYIYVSNTFFLYIYIYIY